MADIFLSYAREDRESAAQIAEALGAAGYDVFWDVEIPPGLSWADFLEEKLSACKAAVVLWSAASTASQWVREEARLARERGKLIPVALDDSPPPFGFGEIQSASLKDWAGQSDHPSWRLLLASLERRMGAAPTPRPQPPPSRSAPRPAAPPTAESAKKKPNLPLVIGGTVAATIVGLGVIGMMMEEEAPAPSTVTATGALSPASAPIAGLPATVQAVVERARAAQAEAQAAAESAAQAQALAGEAIQLANAGTYGYGSAQLNPTTMVVGQALTPNGEAAIGMTAEGESFYGVVQVNAAGAFSAMTGYSDNGRGQTGSGVTTFLSATHGRFVGVSRSPSWYFEGAVEGPIGGYRAAGSGVLNYADGSRYEGEILSTGRDAVVTRQGVGALYDANGRLLEAGRFENDALIAPG